MAHSTNTKPPLKLGARPMVQKPLPSAPGSGSNKHGININQCAFGQGRVYSNAQRRQPKAYGNTAQKNGTQTLQYNNNQKNAIRGFDIGNNAKYDAAHEMAKHTNALPSNFWESESDTDSEEERKDTQEDIVNRWKTQKTNIGDNPNMADTPSDTPEDQVTFGPPQTAHVYDEDTSSEDDESDDGFQKYVAPPKPTLNVDVDAYKKKKEEERWRNNTTMWIVEERNKKHYYDTMWFKVPKLRNGKANGAQLRTYLEASGLNKDQLKQIWKLSDLDKDGKMGNEEFALCMFLIDEAKNGAQIPLTLPLNYVPPSFRGKELVKTPPFEKRKPKTFPPTMALNNGPPTNKQLPQKKALQPTNVNMKPPVKPYIAPKVASKPQAPFGSNTHSTAHRKVVQNKQTSYGVAPNTMQTKPSSYRTTTTNHMGNKPSSSYVARPAPSSFAPVPSKTTPAKPTPAKPTPFGAAPRRNAPQNRPSPFGSNPNAVRNHPQRGNNYQQRKVYSQNERTANPQYRDMDYDEIREKSLKAAKEAGVKAKKAGKAALGWMTKKMNDLNEKAQDNPHNQNNSNKKTY